MTRIGTALTQALRLSKPYFVSEDRRIAWALLAAIVALNLVIVYLNVVYTYWYKVAYNALEAKAAPAFWSSMFLYRVVDGFPYFVPGFSEIAVCLVLVSVYAFYLNQMLEIRWRRWLTQRFVDDWLDRRAYYHLRLRPASEGTLDNPDQRIADDIPAFVSSTLTLGMSLLSNCVTLLSFIGVLWNIVPALTVGRLHVEGYLVWAAVLYSAGGTVLAQLIGRRLIGLTFEQQRFNADFRFGLMRVREHTEQIAFLRGENAEKRTLAERFEAIYRNWWAIMKRTRSLNFFTIGFTQVALIFPLVVAAPGYFAGIFTLGVLMQIASIFGSVQGAFSWFVTSYPDLVDWRATVARLDGFARDVTAALATSAAPRLARSCEGNAIRASDLEIDLPDNRPLLRVDRLDMTPGEPIALGGPSGVGKSTLLRVLAGIWPFAGGRVVVPAERLLFLPQRPYVPLGSLRRAIAYPSSEWAYTDSTLRTALTAAGLPAYANALDAVDDWALRLSGGELQRLAIARALIVSPAWLILDEALSALDETSAAELLLVLRRRLPATQIVSVTHSSAMLALHPRRLAMTRDCDIVTVTAVEANTQPNVA